jgi:hypothetical protein
LTKRGNRSVFPHITGAVYPLCVPCLSAYPPCTLARTPALPGIGHRLSFHLACGPRSCLGLPPSARLLHRLDPHQLRSRSRPYPWTVHPLLHSSRPLRLFDWFLRCLLACRTLEESCRLRLRQYHQRFTLLIDLCASVEVLKLTLGSLNLNDRHGFRPGFNRLRLGVLHQRMRPVVGPQQHHAALARAHPILGGCHQVRLACKTLPCPLILGCLTLPTIKLPHLRPIRLKPSGFLLHNLQHRFASLHRPSPLQTGQVFESCVVGTPAHSFSS